MKKLFSISMFAALLTGGGSLSALEITHGPFLDYPSSNRMVVSCVTDQPGAIQLQFRAENDAQWSVRTIQEGGQILNDQSFHRVVLNDLAPDTQYEYQLQCLDPQTTEPMPETLKTGAFHTFPANNTEADCAVWIVADLQDDGSRARNLDALNRIVPLQNADFAVMLGDFCNSQDHLEENWFKNSIDPLVALGIQQTPMLFVRGNHEWRGADARQWFRTMRDPETRQIYQAFSHGKDFFIVLDAGEDKPAKFSGHHYTDFNDDAAYMQQQRAWLTEVVASEAFRNARYRIVLTHSATHLNSPGYDVQQVNRLTKGLLDGESPENRIHLMIAGHAHYYMRNFGHSNEHIFYKPDQAMFDKKRVNGESYPYTVLVVDGPGYGGSDASVTHLRLNNEGIWIETYALEGNLIESLKIDVYGNGQVLETHDTVCR